MAQQDQPFRIDPEPLDARIRPDELDGGGHVLECVSEGESPGAAPGASIVEVQHIHAGPAKCLSDVEVAFVAREAVQQNYCRMQSSALRQVEETVETGAATLEGKLGSVGREERIAANGIVDSRIV